MLLKYLENIAQAAAAASVKIIKIILSTLVSIAPPAL